jgi:nicotinamidase-related amidase
MSNRNNALIEVNDSVLIVIDVQDAFVDKLPTVSRKPLLDRIAWLIQIAKELQVPLVVTAEDIPTLGGVCPKIEEAIGDDATVLNKMVFGLVGEPAIVNEIESTNRKTAILVG